MTPSKEALPSRPLRNDPLPAHVGPREVTGAQRSEAQGNGRQAVDLQGDVIGSEGVVWGCLRPPAEAGAPSGAPSRRELPNPRAQ